MKVFISADIEGVSGVVHGEHTNRDGREHDYARMLMTKEVNACVEGALEAGAEKVVVNDSHGTMRNIYHEELHSKAELILGSPKKLAMMEGISSEFDAVLFVGYHTMMGSEGVLNHTFHGGVVGSIEVNGIEMGEFGLNALVAGHFNVPVVFVSGCNLVAEEARVCIRDIHSAVVKKTINQTVAQNLHPVKAREVVKEVTKKVLMDYKDIKPFVLEGPYRVEMKFLHTGLADAVEILPFVERVDPLTVAFSGDDVLGCYRLIRSLIMMAGVGGK
jgi:D-amino peptidase